MYMNISIGELKSILHDNINLIDIRSKTKYNSGTILNAINIESNDLLYHYSSYLDKNKKYYIFCDNGINSRKISSILNTLGYQVYNIDGGYNKYILEK